MRHQPVRAGDIVTVAGWGMTQGGFFPSGPGSEELNMIDMNVISNLECRRRLLPLSSIGLLIRDNVFCTFNGRGQSPCFGKSHYASTCHNYLTFKAFRWFWFGFRLERRNCWHRYDGRSMCCRLPGLETSSQSLHSMDWKSHFCLKFTSGKPLKDLRVECCLKQLIRKC